MILKESCKSNTFKDNTYFTVTLKVFTLCFTSTMDSDDLFDELIEFDANVNQTERENHDVSVTRVKGNKQQFNKIDSFMNGWFKQIII